MTTALLLCPASRATADVIELKTEKAGGSELTLALNANVTAQLSWSNGETESVTFTGFPQTITAKAASLTITSESSITRFYAPSDGLVSLNVGQAPALTELFCPDNALTTLDLTANSAIEEIDCQGNAITDLTLKNSRNIKVLNCAQNKLESLSYPTGTSMKMLICADNKLSTFSYQTSLKALQTLWAQHNAFTTLNIRNSGDLRTLCLSSNALTSLTLGAMPGLTDVWVDNNALEKLDLSAGSPRLRILSADHNNLSLISWDADCAPTLTKFYGHNNALFFNSFPTPRTGLTATYDDQQPFKFSDDVNINEEVSYDKLFDNGFGLSLSYTMALKNGEGETLQAGKNKDYYRRLGSNFTYYTAQKDVTATITCNRYRMTLTSRPYNVTDPATGIHDATADTTGPEITTSKGMLAVKSGTSGILRVHDIAGRTIINTAVNAGNHSWPLPSGTYIVNGKKVLVP